MDKAFFDVRITHPNAQSMRTLSLSQVYHRHEEEKRRTYLNRITEVERASFTPLVYTTSGGMGPECERFHQRLAELVSLKRRETLADTIRYIRQRVRFTILRTTLVAIRGFRHDKSLKPEPRPVSEVDFNIANENQLQ